jgi:hypothetical protein
MSLDEMIDLGHIINFKAGWLISRYGSTISYRQKKYTPSNGDRCTSFITPSNAIPYLEVMSSNMDLCHVGLQSYQD